VWVFKSGIWSFGVFSSGFVVLEVGVRGSGFGVWGLGCKG
jgi:hypothetical protein